jgi:phosphatidylserine/phosphatidylglycerophosphate/cardiolipin synthase-like enzyme
MSTPHRFLVVRVLLIALIPLLTPAAVASPVVVRDVVVSEIAWMGTTVSPNDEWIELYNNTSGSISLAGWTLRTADGTPSITLQGTIPAHGYYLLERTDDTTVPGVTADRTYTGALGDAGEDLLLRDAASILIDQVNSSGGWFAGHGAGRVPMVRMNTLEEGSRSTNWTYNPRCGTATNSAGVSHSCVLTTTDVGHAFDYAVYFNERATTAITTTTQQTSIEDALLAQINGAATRIDVALYGLDRQSVIDALIAAHNRGVIVRVVGDDDAALNEYQAGYQALTTDGITVITDTSPSQIQHNKFMVFDGAVVWTGSTNFTNTCLTLNANNSLVVTDTTLSTIYTAEFNEMWGGAFHSTKSDNTPHLLNYNGTLVKSFFSPTDLVAFEVWDELAHADATIHFGMFFWTDPVLTQRVVQRMNTGVQVYGVWDQLGAGNVSSADVPLCLSGAQIKIEDFAGKVHHKFAVIDVNGSDPTVILGSYNWTDSGAYDNDENTLIVHDAALAQAYYAEWQRLWSALGSDRLCIPHKTYLPIAMQSIDP